MPSRKEIAALFAGITSASVACLILFPGPFIRNSQSADQAPGVATVSSATTSGTPPTTATPTPTRTSTVKFTPAYTSRCGCPPGKTCLTFDDSYYGGKAGDVVRLAQYANKRGVGLIIFQLTQPADDYKAQTGIDIFPPMRDAGMYPGNHTYSHKILTTVTPAVAEWEITHGTMSGWLRPPGGASTAAIRNLAYKHQIDVCTWTYDSRDWEAVNGKFLTGTEICRKVMTQAPIGAVILLHLNHNAAVFNTKTSTFDALDCLINGLRAKGHNLCRPYTTTHPGVATPEKLYSLPC